MNLALVCAHKDSEGCPDKTLRELGGRSLLQIAVDKARTATLIDRIAVCTNYPQDSVPDWSPEDVWIDRPYKTTADTLCGPRIPKWSLWRYALDVWEAQELTPSAFVDIDVSRPLTTAEDIDRLVLAAQPGKPMAAVCRAKKSPWSDSFVLRPWPNAPLARTIDARHEARQVQPQVYEYGGLYYCPRTVLRDQRNMWDAQPLPYEIPRAHSFDVDDELDWQVVQDQWRRQNVVEYRIDPHGPGVFDTSEYARTGGWR